ncbi:RNA polymerase sigma factor sigA [Hibiscus syriacus]|uniref:RNA polymerase sigma factor sigA n=1 Tax=Hibiscus syriacus TaxID=106335 RepID=A0A6A3B718_HIBSY|nr:RNA polymerase sigma factor sigA [Hibiscus syriacus]
MTVDTDLPPERVAKKPSNCSQSLLSSDRHSWSIKAVKERVNTASIASTAEPLFGGSDDLEEESYDLDYSVEALLLLQKSMLESNGLSHSNRQFEKVMRRYLLLVLDKVRSLIGPELLRSRSKGYVKGVVTAELLSHTEVVRLSKKIRAGLSLEDQRFRLKERLGCEPSDEQLATSLKISRTELHSILFECSFARDKLAMSNVRLVMSTAQRYDNLGGKMSDLIQGGLIGLLRGIEKFDSSKGYKISTYDYWWISQFTFFLGVSRALVENSRTLRLPTHMHERLGLIRNAKSRLREKGIVPTIDRIAESPNMSQKKVCNATEVFSLDRDAFPSINGLPGETHHSYIADNHEGNNPWHGVDEWALQADRYNTGRTREGDHATVPRSR